MEVLKKLNIGFRYFDVSKDEKAFEWVKEMGYLQVPVVVPSFDKDVRDPKGEKIDHWSGFRPDLLNQL